MKSKFINYYMNIANLTAELSSAVRLKVGAIAVKDNKIISIGYNGTLPGTDNNCEYKEYSQILPDSLDNHSYEFISKEYPFQEQHGPIVRRYKLVTKPEVIHAEENCIGKLAASTESAMGSELFVTVAPCVECAKLIVVSKVKKVYFGAFYKNVDGLEVLKKGGVEYEQVGVDPKV